jgi:hypothetical protein
MKQKTCTCKCQFVVDTHIFLPFEEEDVKMVIHQAGTSHDQATTSLKDVGGELVVDAVLLLENNSKSALAVQACDHDPARSSFFYSTEILGRAQSQGRQTGTRIALWKAESRRGVIDGQWACDVWGR